MSRYCEKKMVGNAMSKSHNLLRQTLVESKSLGPDY